MCERELSTSKQKHSKLSDPGLEADHLAKRKLRSRDETHVFIKG